MVDVQDQIRELIEKGQEMTISRVVKTWRSAPRQAGAALIVTDTGAMHGSVSGGCVEKAVMVKAMKALETGSAVLDVYGVANEDAWEVGLSCGGGLTVFTQPFFEKALYEELQARQSANRGTVLLTKLDESGENTLIDPDNIEVHGLEESLQEAIKDLYGKGLSQIVEAGDQAYFVHSFPTRPTMIMIGSAHISSELTGLAHLYGFETVLIDPRDTFAKKTHYDSQPGTIHVNWPQDVLPSYKLDKDTYIVILSHDPKIDDEALKLVLRSEVAYIGALGSRKTHARRVARMNEYGFSEEDVLRIDAPIGMDIGANGAGEIALSIIAQVISHKNKAHLPA